MAKYAAQCRIDGKAVNFTVRAPDMESALRQLKRDNPHGSAFTVWNPDHYPPREGSESEG